MEFLAWVAFFAGLFTSISLGLYYKYKTDVIISNRVPSESLGELYKTKAMARTMRSRSASLRWGGLIAGIGFGGVTGLMIWILNLDWINSFYDRSQYDDEYMAFSAIACIAFTILCGGAGMIAAYFLERRLDKKSK